MDIENRFLEMNTDADNKSVCRISSLNIEQSDGTEKLQHIMAIINKLNS